MSAGLYASRGTVAALALKGAAALSLLAAAMHLWVVPEPLEEWRGYGTFLWCWPPPRGCTPSPCCAGRPPDRSSCSAWPATLPS